MKYLRHDIWDIHDHGFTICICTNGFVKKDGKAVMGRGLALEATKKFPTIQEKLGNELNNKGNNVFLFRQMRLITFPTKHNWWENSDTELIRRSCKQLRRMLEFLIPDAFSPKRDVVFLPIPGIGNGKLDKEIVVPILEDELEGCNNICIVEEP